jgi:TldD protein
MLGKPRFNELKGYENDLRKHLEECEKFLLESEAVEPGVYPVVLAPIVTGVFAHECFGHKSESDFMMGDEATRKEWALGKKVGPDDLTIMESGLEPGNGYVPYDDEGNAATKTYLIKNGILSGRLHSAATAADLGEPVTGNARAMNFEYEPIVRMTTTFIDKGTKTFDQLISETKNGIYVKDIFHGSGMSTFTLAPSLAYYIKDGKIGKPVRVSVVSGNVFESLSNVDGIADDLKMAAFVIGGCGKMDQGPLSVGFGGPHIRIQNMQVQ